jgi:hypothetical protein
MPLPYPGPACATLCRDGSPAEPPACPEGSGAEPPPCCGAAPAATRGWLLIEHPGPWPAFGHPSDLPRALAEAADRLTAAGVRPQLIRRTDRDGRRGDGERAVYLAGGSGGGRWIERVDPRLLTDRREAARLRPTLFRSRRGPGLGRPGGPLLLVCTHGRREVCCARFGRPVAVALAARFGPLVWETTHVGGDRFAANLVLLPEGVYFGRLDPRRAVSVAEGALVGRLDLAAYRGTAGRSAADQSAEWHLRRALGEQTLAALRPLAPREPGVHRFAHAGPGIEAAHYEVRVEAYPGTDSADAADAEPAGYRLVSITSPRRARVAVAG